MKVYFYSCYRHDFDCGNRIAVNSFICGCFNHNFMSSERSSHKLILFYSPVVNLKKKRKKLPEIIYSRFLDLDIN